MTRVADQVLDRGAPRAAPPRGVHGLAKTLAFLTFAVALTGGGVNSTNSPLADPYWPSFGGRWFPDLSRMFEHPGLLLEHGHRLLVGIVGIGIVVLAVLLRRRDARLVVRRLATASVALVLLAAALGGVTVLIGKSTVLSVVHNAMAMLLVAAVTTLAVVTGRPWFDETTRIGSEAARGLLGFSAAVLGAVYLQVVLGAVPRHATLESGGRTLVLVGDALHIMWAFVVFAVVVMVYLEISRNRRALSGERDSPALFRPAVSLVFLLVLQIFVGFAAFIYQPKTPPSVTELEGGAAGSDGAHALSASAHQTLGVLMLVAAVILAARAVRLRELAVADPDDRARDGALGRAVGGEVER